MVPPQPEYSRYELRYNGVDGRTGAETVEDFIVPGGGKPWRRSVTQLVEYERASPPDSTFSLGQCGLPEAVAAKPKSAATHYHWLTAAAALAYIARRVAVARAGRSVR